MSSKETKKLINSLAETISIIPRAEKSKRAMLSLSKINLSFKYEARTSKEMAVPARIIIFKY